MVRALGFEIDQALVGGQLGLCRILAEVEGDAVEEGHVVFRMIIRKFDEWCSRCDV